MSQADNSVKHDEICQLAIPNQISLILMHVPSLVKIPWHLHKLSSGNENMGVSRADNCIKMWWNLLISNPKPDLHNINAHIKFGENPMMFTQVITWKLNTDGWMDVGQTEGWTDTWTSNVKHNTQPLSCGRDYRVAGYKKQIQNVVCCSCDLSLRVKNPQKWSHGNVWATLCVYWDCPAPKTLIAHLVLIFYKVYCHPYRHFRFINI